MKKIKIFLFVTLFAFLLGGLGHAVLRSDLIKLSDIDIRGAQPETAERLRSRLHSKVGDPFWKISVEREAQSIKQDPWVESVDVIRRLPNTLLVSVTERKPIAVMGSGDGQFKFVDDTGFVIGSADPREVAGHPALMGRNFQEQGSLRGKALDLLKSFPKEGSLSQTDISELQFSDEHGFQVILAKTGMVVELGKDNLPLHVDRARRVVQYLHQHGINASHVDSDYAKKVLVKLRKGR